MNYNSKGSSDSAADLARLVRHLYRQGWRLVAEGGDLAGISSEEQSEIDAALERLFGRLRQQVDDLFRQLEEHGRSLYIPHEALLAAFTQLGALQDVATASLDQIEETWLATMMPALAPRLGMFQNKQERIQALVESLAELRSAQDAYLTLARGCADEAVDGFEQMIGQKASPLAFRDLYEAWLGAGEEAYERMLGSDAYSQSVARLANASAAFNAGVQESMDDVLEQFSLPTRRELISTQQRLHELRRRQRASERAVPAELAELRREMAALRAEMDQLRGSPVGEPTAPTGARDSAKKGRRRAY